MSSLAIAARWAAGASLWREVGIGEVRGGQMIHHGDLVHGVVMSVWAMAIAVEF